MTEGRRMFQPTKAPITLTEAAAARVRDLVANSGDEGVLGLRVGVKNTGCSGLSYVVEYAKERKRFEDMVEDKGVTLFIDPTAVMFILGDGLQGGQDVLRVRLQQPERDRPLRLRRELQRRRRAGVSARPPFYVIPDGRAAHGAAEPEPNRRS